MHARLVTWNFECSESTLATASRNAWPKTQLLSMAFYARSSRKELRCLTNVRIPCAAPSFVTSIKESWLKLKFNTPRVTAATVKASQAMRELRLSERRQAN